MLVSEPFVHYKGIDQSKCRMVEGAGQGPDNIEAQFFPQSDGDVITAGDEVELHCLETHRDCCTLRVLAHLPRNAHASSAG